jgi:hypothetical protein
MKKLLITLALIAAATPAIAKDDVISVGDVMDWTANKKTSSLAWGYMSGVNNTMLMANAFAETTHKQKLYCQPNTLSINPQKLAEIVESYAKEHPDAYAQDFSAVAIHAMTVKYPC